MRPAIATFDCYGTLIDWEGGFGSFLYEKALRARVDELVPGRELRERFEAIQFELIQGEYRPYKDVLAESLRLLCEERGWPYDPAEDGKAVVRAMRSWQPFPDTRPALRRTRAAGVRLMIVSNTDRDIMEHTLRQLEVPFDDVQVAEDVGAYKPSDEVFRRALERIGEPPERVLHVAFGFKYDIGPAARAGMRTAWVNRHQEPPPGDSPYDHEWRDLWGLAELAEAP
ncbi:MAG: haloacid dehalogenase type II [Actinomycetota bacterium]|nr:haloacid dehalogenase type II [Actinomycetota bacterium]